jgi:uncharacterized protein YpuA (DUF1002 family)
MNEDQSLPVLAAHMAHLVKAVDEMRSDMKLMPTQMAQTYTTAAEFGQFKLDFKQVRDDIKGLSEKMDTRDAHFVTQESFDKVCATIVTKDQFFLYKAILGLIGSTVIVGLIQAAFSYFKS